MPTGESRPVIDTSKMSSAQREALELTEAAREAVEAEHGFVGGLFMGRLNVSAIQAFPVQTTDDRAQRDAFLQRMASNGKERVAPDYIHRNGEIIRAAIDALAELCIFGI